MSLAKTMRQRESSATASKENSAKVEEQKGRVHYRSTPNHPLSLSLSLSLSKSKSKPLPTLAPISLPKSKPPHLDLSFSKPKSKLYPKNYNLNLKRKINKRKPRGSRKMKNEWYYVWVLCLLMMLCLIDKKI